MTILQALVYGIIQGIGEFLPISSSAHLIFVPWVLGWHDRGLSFDVALHLGTLIAVVVFFFRDWLRLICAGFTNVKSQDGKLFWFLVLATIPGGIAGMLFEEQAETVFRNPALIGVMLIIMGLILYVADKKGSKSIQIKNAGFSRSILIGISQALAIIPGVSRSGITMSAGLALGLTRESVARFTFLLSTPLILGAGLAKIKDLVNSQIDLPLIIGIASSAIVGLLSIKFLLKYLKTEGFGIFVLYRIVIGIMLICIYFTR